MLTPIYSLYNDYIDEFGMAQDKPVPYIGGNGLLRTGEVCAFLGEKGFITEKMAGIFRTAAVGCQIQEGLFARHPKLWRDSQESVDDMVGLIMIASYCRCPELVHQWIDFGERGYKLPGWPIRIPFYYPNEPQYQQKFGWRAWFYKFFTLRCSMAWADYRLDRLGHDGWFLRLCWSLDIATTGIFKRDGQDQWILSNLLIMAAKRLHEDHGIVGWAIKRNLARRQRLYPGGLASIYAIYFRENNDAPPNDDHWLVRFLRTPG